MGYGLGGKALSDPSDNSNLNLPNLHIEYQCVIVRIESCKPT